MSIGIWAMRQLNPDLHVDMTFMYLLHEMTKVNVTIINAYLHEYILKPAKYVFT